MIIYKITNSINGKIYIGQTSRSLDQRWKEHLYCINKRKLPLYNAFNKYGIENFTKEILETVSENVEAFEREDYWVKFYNSRDVNIGYNIAKPSKSFWSGCHHTEDVKNKMIIKKYKPVYQYNLNGNFIKYWKSIKDAANKLNIHKTCISQNCLNKTKTAGGYIWSFYKILNDDNLDKKMINRNSVRVYQYDLNFNYINEYKSITYAQTITGILKPCIISCCKNKQKSAGGYIWKYEKIKETNV